MILACTGNNFIVEELVCKLLSLPQNIVLTNHILHLKSITKIAWVFYKKLKHLIEKSMSSKTGLETSKVHVCQMDDKLRRNNYSLPLQNSFK